MHFFFILVTNDFVHADLVHADFSQTEKNARAKDRVYSLKLQDKSGQQRSACMEYESFSYCEPVALF